MTKVFILYTGGTIGMAPQEPDKPGSPLVPKGLEELTPYFPGLASNPQLKLEFKSFDTPLDSSNLGPSDWIEMARIIEAAYADHDGFVILHGTDTMAYTSSALSFMFENLAKPVVITGSQLPISDIRTDAVQNLVNSVQVAGWKAFHLPCIPEVVIVFADRIVRGCRARKVSASSWAGFDSPNFPLLGKIGEHIRIDTRLLRPMPAAGQSFQINTELDTRVMDIGLTPGFSADHLRALLLQDDSQKAIQAIVLRTYGTGNAPNFPEFLDVIKQVNDKKKAVLNVTQCLEGTVEMGLYAASSGLLDRGVISALDMTPEAALTKLMWTLGTKIGDQVAVQMQVNQRGEQSQNLFDLRYGPCSEQDRFVKYATPDRRFDVRNLARSVVRISGLTFSDASRGSALPGVKIFMNMPSATADTPESNPRCVASTSFPWPKEPENIAVILDEGKTKSVIGDGDITLTIVPLDASAKLSFDGLYLSLFAMA